MDYLHLIVEFVRNGNILLSKPLGIGFDITYGWLTIAACITSRVGKLVCRDACSGISSKRLHDHFTSGLTLWHLRSLCT